MATKKTARKYSPAAGEQVKREMEEFKAGELYSGSGQKVTNPKQAIAIGLSEARRAGKKVPPNPHAPAKKSAKKAAGKKVAAKKDAAKKSVTKTSVAKKQAAKT